MNRYFDLMILYQILHKYYATAIKTQEENYQLFEVK